MREQQFFLQGKRLAIFLNNKKFLEVLQPISAYPWYSSNPSLANMLRRWYQKIPESYSYLIPPIVIL
jgi:hypothetical protein